MNPDIDLRLKSLEKALTDVISAAVPESEQLARDQINLVVGHLKVIGTHWKYALRYELGTMDALRRLADQLREFTDGGMHTALDEACASVDAVDREAFDDVQNAQRALAVAIDGVIAAGYTTDRMEPALRDAVLDHYAHAAPRERIWHQGSGLDPDAASLAALHTLFSRNQA